jgi:hypothetical protein
MKSSDAWTIAVYLAGGENVSREMIPALHDMRDAALSNRPALRVLAQFEPEGKRPRLFAFHDELSAHFAVPRRHGRASTSMGLANYQYTVEPEAGGSEKSGSLPLLHDFVETGRSAARDGRLLVVVSGHANGAVGEFLGFRNMDPLYLGDLKEAFKPRVETTKKIDLLGMDCCHMSMVEVCSEVAPYVRYLVASEGYILNHGWPYRTILDAMAGLEPEEAGAEIVRQYVGSYADYLLLEIPSHCALSNLDRIDVLEEAIRHLARLLTSKIDDPCVWRPTVLAHWEAQSYKDEEYVDLADFCDRLRIHIDDPEIPDACSRVIEGVAQVVRVNCFSGSAFQFSTGLAIYFPWCNDAVKERNAAKAEPSELERYRELTFSRKTGWGDFLDAYLWATRRDSGSALFARLKSTESFWSLSLPGPTGAGNLSKSKDKEVRMTMAIKRVPPWNLKGGQAKSDLKNHPRTEGSGDSSAPIRRVPPWNLKGAVPTTLRLKNHPQKREA